MSRRRAGRPASLAFEIQEARGLRRFYLMGLKAWLLGRRYGWGEVWARTRRYIQRKGLAGALWGEEAGNYAAYLAATAPTGTEEAIIRAWIAQQGESLPEIGVLVTIHEPPLEFLEAAVASVRGQLYPNWRLMLSLDGPQAEELVAACERMDHADPRIRVAGRDLHAGISATLNDGLRSLDTPWVTFLDQDDFLDPRALYWVARKVVEASPDVVYTDEDQVDERGRRLDPLFKPDWSPFLLWSMNYWGHLVAVRRDLLKELGGFRPEMDGSQDYDCWLRLTDRERTIAHVPRVAYHWRLHAGSTAGDVGGSSAKPQAFDAAERGLRETLARRFVAAELEQFCPGRFRVRFIPQGKTHVSVIIPFRDRTQLLQACLTSLEAAANGQQVDHEIILVDNGSTEADTLVLVEQWRLRPNVKVLRWEEPFNFSRMNKRAAALANGQVLCFLNNDTEVRTPCWLDVLTGLLQQPRVGAVGPKLLFPNGRVQHAGVIIGLGGVTGHAFYGHSDNSGYMDLLRVTRNVAAVTGACLLTYRDLFLDLGGFDESLSVAFNDVDYCLRLLEHGEQVVWTPDVVLIHHESTSRGGALEPRADIERFERKWARILRTGDPFFSPNLSTESPSFVLKKERAV